MDSRAKRVLLVTDRIFWHTSGGEKARIASLYRYLVAQGFEVPVFFVGTLNERDRTTTQPDLARVQLYLGGGVTSPRLRKARSPIGLRRRIGSWKRRLAKGLRNARRAVASGVSRRGVDRGTASRSAASQQERTLESFVSDSEIQRFHAVCGQLRPEFVLVQYVNLAYLVRESRDLLAGTTRTLIDTHDIAHERRQTFHDYGAPHWLDVSEEEEAAALTAFDVVMAIQDDDAETLRRMLPNRSVITVGHAAELSVPVTRRAPTVVVTFVGSNVTPNEHAIAGFLESVWPALRDKLGDAVTLRIVGNVCSMLDLDAVPEGVQLLGQVDDLASVYRDTDVVINPVRFGAGLKIKNVEALCAAKSLLTTSKGATGLGKEGVGRAFFVCDTPEAYLERLCSLVENPALREETGRNAYAHATRHFSADAAYAPLRELLTEGR